MHEHHVLPPAWDNGAMLNFSRMVTAMRGHNQTVTYVLPAPHEYFLSIYNSTLDRFVVQAFSVEEDFDAFQSTYSESPVVLGPV